MKAKIIALLVLIATVILFTISCGDTGNTPTPTPNPPANEGGGSEKPGEEEKEEAPIIKYTITWMDENGTKITDTTVEEGKTPSYTYTVTDTAEWDYTFDGWASSQSGDVLTAIPAASANATYYAKVSAVKKTYTVSFNSMGGSAVASQSVEYGEFATAPEAPTYEGYRFLGWSETEGGTTAIDFTAPIKANTTYYAIWNEVVNVKALLAALLSGYNLNPMSFIPETMRQDYSANLVSAEDIVSDYSSFVEIDDVTYGFGEQWNMILENIAQSQTFFNVLSAVDAISAASITAFNNYFDQNPSDTAHHEFASGTYNVTISFDGDVIYYVLEYTATLPVLGEQSIQIALSMDAESGERTGRMQLGDANALIYTSTEDSYEFAIKYLGVRTAYFAVARDEDGNVTGKISEHLTVSGVGISSAADFYITEDYVSVIGNKASGMILFEGTVAELYDAENGKMIGYEVKETLSSIEYNTLWFNLSDIGGIESFKYVAAEGDNPAKIYVNGLSDEWATKKVGGFSLKALSRRFDIEFRTQYVYSYDAVNETYVKHEVLVPMLFVQEENYETLIADVSSVNDVIIIPLINSADLSKLMLDYDELIPVFVASKDVITPDVIIAYIGSKIEFE